MLAPAQLPDKFVQWNKRHSAPFGRSLPFDVKGKVGLWLKGPFSIQPNSLARRFEFPWAHEQIATLPRGSVIVEIGGGLSGLQFVLAREGYEVINVDPGMAAKGVGWPAEVERHHAMSRIFRAPARLIPTVIENADLPAASADAILCVSTLEHLTPEDLEGAAASIRRVLKPGGLLVLTVDLFLDVRPFAAATSNQWGTNIDVYDFLNRAGLTLASGDRRCLLGFPEFDQMFVREHRDQFISDVSGNALAQCLTARPT